MLPLQEPVPAKAGRSSREAACPALDAGGEGFPCTAAGPLRPYGAPPLGTGRKFRTEHIQGSRIGEAPLCSPCKGSSREAGEGFPRVTTNHRQPSPTNTFQTQPPPTTPQTTKPSNSRHMTPFFSHTPPRKKFPTDRQPSDAPPGPLRPFGAPPLGTGRKFRSGDVRFSTVRAVPICSPCKGSSREAGEGFPGGRPTAATPSPTPTLC